MARRSLEERRSQYLDIGASIIAEAFDGTGSDPALALSHVKMADVAERANVTKGALYHIWESQELFWQDLLNRLLEINAGLLSDYLNDLTARESSDLAGVPTMFDHADAVFRSMSVKPALFARIGLVSYLADEDVRKQFDDQYHESIEGYRQSLEVAISGMGRRLKQGMDVFGLLVTIDALLEGLCLNNRLSEERTPDVVLPDGSEATLYSVALEAIVVGFTEPIVGDADESVPVGAMADIAARFSGNSGMVSPHAIDEDEVRFWSDRALTDEGFATSERQSVTSFGGDSS